MKEPATTSDSSPESQNLGTDHMPKSKRRLLLLLSLFAGLALLTLAVILWAANNKESAPTSPTEVTNQDSQTPAVTCGADENEQASEGIFCSEEIGVKLQVPDLFKGGLAKGENYKLYNYDFDKQDMVVAGQSELVYEATYNDPKNSEMANVYKLLIARTPLISRQGPCFEPCQFDSKTKTLYENKTQPEDNKLTLGPEIESVTVDGVKFFKAVIGDAGDYNVTYMGVVGDKVIEIILRSDTYVGESDEKYDVDRDELFIDFDNLLKTLQVLN